MPDTVEYEVKKLIIKPTKINLDNFSNSNKETITGDTKTEQQTTKQHEHQETTDIEETSTTTTSYNEQHLTTEIRKNKIDTPEDPPEITQNNNKCVVS